MNIEFDEYLKKQRDINDKQLVVIKRYSKFVKGQLVFFFDCRCAQHDRITVIFPIR